VGQIAGALQEFNGSAADEIERRREVETLLVTVDNHTEAMKKVLNWLR